MTDFSSVDSARETLAKFDRMIAEDERDTRETVERLKAAGFDYTSEPVKKAWDACGARLKPTRDAREKLVQAMATVAAAQPPSMVIVQQLRSK